MSTLLLVLATAVSQFLAAAAQLQSTTAGKALAVGVTPEALVIAQFTEAEAQVVLARLEAASNDWQALEQLKNEADALSAEATRLCELLYETPDDADLHHQHELAVQQLNETRAMMAQLREALFEEAMNGFAPQRVGAVRVYGRGADRRVPPAFCATDQSSSDWCEIEGALRSERRAQRRNEPVPPDASEVLTEIRIRPEVIEADADLAENLPRMADVFYGL